MRDAAPHVRAPPSTTSPLLRLCRAALLLTLIAPATACTTLVAGRAATADGSLLAAHSNDGDGATIGNLAIVPAENWTLPSSRAVSGGSIPQVAHTHAYYTKVGGYASINEHQVGLAESTAVAVFPGQRAKAKLNIVDLSALALERAQTSRDAVRTMGELAELHGYYDAGESLLVLDPTEAFIFHVLPDHSGASAVWVAQRVPDSHVGVVANSFTVRVIDQHDEHGFLFSKTLEAAALATGRWSTGTPLDFTRVFAGPEPGRKYYSGRRMWAAFRRLAPAAAASLSPEYEEYVSACPYPSTLPAANLTAASMRDAMRDFYQGTPYDLSVGVAAGPFGSPARWKAAAGSVDGAFERPIAIQRTILSYVLTCRSWLPDAIGGVMWMAMHAAHTSVYVPFFAGATRVDVPLPIGFTNNSVAVDRGVGAWQASRFVFAAAQLDFQRSIGLVRHAQAKWEQAGEVLIDSAAAAFRAANASMAEVARWSSMHAAKTVAAWWQLSDELIVGVAYPSTIYPQWWLEEPAVNFTGGPPPSPDVPPPPKLATAPSAK